MDVRDNVVSNYGTGVRLVANCNTTDFRCNLIYDCTTGTYLEQASMTTQGSGTNAWDNEWDGITNYKIDGNLNLVSTSSGKLDWYYRGSGISSYEPIPFNSTLANKFFPLSNATGVPPCANYCAPCEFVINDIEALERVVGNQNVYEIYPDESRQLDKWYVYNVLHEYPNLMTNSYLLQSYYSTEDAGNTGRFRRLTELINNEQWDSSTYALNEIVTENNVEFNMKRVCELYIANQIQENSEFNEEEIIELSGIACQNAWYGGDAVFMARALLGLEIDDVRENLRVSYNPMNEKQSLAYPNPTSGKINLSAMENATILVKDASGRILMNKKVNNGQVDLSALENGCYFIQKESGAIIKISVLK